MLRVSCHLCGFFFFDRAQSFLRQGLFPDHLGNVSNFPTVPRLTISLTVCVCATAPQIQAYVSALSLMWMTLFDVLLGGWC